MTSFFRRAGQDLTRLFKSLADPSAESERVVGYAKDVGGVAQLFARSPDYPRQVSGVECNIFDRPLVPHPLDDEFESTTLDPTWTMSGTVLTENAINPYGSTPSYALHTNYRPSWLMLQASTSAGTRFSKDISSISAGDFFVWFRGSFNERWDGIGNNDGLISLDLTASPWTGGDRVSMQLNAPDPGTVRAEFFITVGGSTTTTIGVTRNQSSGGFTWLQPIEAAGIQKIGTTARRSGSARRRTPRTSRWRHSQF